jgi:hypothetical protein
MNDLNQFNQFALYHSAFENDAAAQAGLSKLTTPVHQAGGALWPSLAHGVGPSFVVVALPASLSPEQVDALLPLHALPVASVDAAQITSALDPQFVAPVVVVPVVEPQEGPDGDQSA